MSKRKRSSSYSKSSNNSFVKTHSFLVDKPIDILPGLNSITFAQGVIEPINKHFLVSFCIQNTYEDKIIDENSQHLARSYNILGYEVIEIQNSNAQGFGFKFPPGNVQILNTNNPESFEIESFSQSSLSFTDESEVIRFNLREIPTLIGHRSETKSTRDDKKCTITDDIVLTVTNKSYHPITALVEDELYRWKNWKITQTSTEFHPNGKDKARWILKLPPNACETIHYTVQYSWEE